MRGPLTPATAATTLCDCLDRANNIFLKLSPFGGSMAFFRYSRVKMQVPRDVSQMSTIPLVPEGEGSQIARSSLSHEMAIAAASIGILHVSLCVVMSHMLTVPSFRAKASRFPSKEKVGKLKPQLVFSFVLTRYFLIISQISTCRRTKPDSRDTSRRLSGDEVGE